MTEELTLDTLDTLELECGVVLKFKAVNKMMIADFFGSLTTTNGKVDPKSVGHKSFNKMMRYVCGWGVTTEIPPGEKQDYEMFGGPRQQRASWVIETATDSELSQVMAQVLILTMPEARKKMAAAKQKKAETTELDELRAKVAQLESEKVEDGEQH